MYHRWRMYLEHGEIHVYFETLRLNDLLTFFAVQICAPCNSLPPTPPPHPSPSLTLLFIVTFDGVIETSHRNSQTRFKHVQTCCYLRSNKSSVNLRHFRASKTTCRGVCLFVCLCVCLFVCLCVCVFAHHRIAAIVYINVVLSKE